MLAWTDAFLAPEPHADEALRREMLAQCTPAEIVELSTGLTLFMGFSKIALALGGVPDELPVTVQPTPDVPLLRLGRKTGREVLHDPEGGKRWEWQHQEDGTSVWTQFWPNGRAMAESRWRGMFADGPAIRWNSEGKELSRVVFGGGKLSGEPGTVSPTTPASVAAGYSDAPANPAMRPIQDVSGLPRVLLIGDSISIGYTLAVRERLAGKANVHRIPENAGSTTNGLVKLDAWLGDQRWDVVHFNWGLHDLKIMASGHQQVPLPEYERNLEQLVQRLQETGARLVWATTTPVPEGKLGTPRRSVDVTRYNEAARKVMEKHGVVVNDLCAFALPQLSKIQTGIWSAYRKPNSTSSNCAASMPAPAATCSTWHASRPDCVWKSPVSCSAL